MGIYIKGIEMPKDESEYWHIFITPYGDVYSFEGRLPEKPIANAIDVSAHGDLIDKDALKRLRKCELDEYSDGWTFKELWEAEEKDIDSLLVVIPAERSEDA